MAKAKTKYVCSECGYEAAKWLGKCPECGCWNSMSEQIAEEEVPEKKLRRAAGGRAEPRLMKDIPDDAQERMSTGIGELDRVLGGGAVEGSVTLAGGEPGVGKSTLLTQAAANLARQGRRALYVSGEESARQIKLRARRLDADAEGLYLLSENDVTAVESALNKLQPDFVVIDSIQTMYRPDMASAPGSVSQVRESAALISRYVKAAGCAAFLVGHVTKDGSIAGPRVLEHMVDAVLYFEGDRARQYRLLRAVKNRYGSVNELGMFEMTDRGMREVPNASEVLLSEHSESHSGSVVFCAVEGARPLLVDVQALVATSPLGNPRRMTSGVDLNRLALLLAVMEKRGGFPLYTQDVYVNVAGGLTLDEPAADLAVCAAIASSARNRPLGRWAVMGEVGLAGELRPVPQAERRVAECANLGYGEILLPGGNRRGLTPPPGANLHFADTLPEAMRLLRLYPAQQGQE